MLIRNDSQSKSNLELNRYLKLGLGLENIVRLHMAILPYLRHLISIGKSNRQDNLYSQCGPRKMLSKSLFY